MAYHELMPKGELNPIVPTSSNAYQSEYSPPDTYVSDCSEFYGVSAVYTYDANTFMFIYFKQFVYGPQDTCFFGYLPVMLFRDGRVSNAYYGLGLWGSYQNDWNNTVMDGTGLIFTLTADYNGTDYNELENLYAAEVKLFHNNHTYTNKTTPAKCADKPNFSFETQDTNQQVRGWYCVRPRSEGYPFEEHFDPTEYETKPFGYAWAYGEGTFGPKVMHATRGTCAMHFNVGSDSGTYNFDSQVVDDNSDSDLFSCFQDSIILNGGSGQSVSVSQISNFSLGNINVSAEAFLYYSDFPRSGIPGVTTTTVPTSTEMNPTGSTEMSTTEEDSDCAVVFVQYWYVVLLLVLFLWQLE